MKDLFREIVIYYNANSSILQKVRRQHLSNFAIALSMKEFWSIVLKAGLLTKELNNMLDGTYTWMLRSELGVSLKRAQNKQRAQ